MYITSLLWQQKVQAW